MNWESNTYWFISFIITLLVHDFKQAKAWHNVWHFSDTLWHLYCDVWQDLWQNVASRQIECDPCYIFWPTDIFDKVWHICDITDSCVTYDVAVKYYWCVCDRDYWCICDITSTSVTLSLYLWQYPCICDINPISVTLTLYLWHNFCICDIINVSVTSLM